MRLIVVFLLCLAPSTFVAAAEVLDVPMRFGHYHVEFAVGADGKAVETNEWSRTILKESALEDSKRASVSYSTSAQSGEILTAYTQKADGRRIDVPKDNYQIEVNKGKEAASPVYSDWTTMTVVFPDVAVGDTVVLAYRITDKEAMFPDQYSTSEIFYKSTAYDEVKVRIDYPASMAVQHEGRGMKETISTAGDRKRVEWTWSNPSPIKSERLNYSVFDPEQEVGYAFSTFRDYAHIAAAYGTRAHPKAAVTERIEKLAAEIVQNKSERKAQARALYEWVATNITYAGNCIGVGAVVPRDLTVVLDNKMGDCKDHATLLEALLNARGIKSTQALVNSGSMYRLPRIPLASNVNHVINYLPEFDLFVDSTSNSTPFGLLPFEVQDKPALLVSGFRAGLKTPVPSPENNRQTIRSAFKIADDGSVSGTMEVQQAGNAAVHSRTAARMISRDLEADLVKNSFRNQGVNGSGTFEKEDPTALTDTYRFKATFKAEKYMKPSGPGAFYVSPPLGLASTIFAASKAALEPDFGFPATCAGGTLVEEYTIQLPKSIKVLAIPQDMKTVTPLVSYHATYKRKGNTLTAKRTLEDRTPGNVCSPEVLAQYRKFAEPVVDNIKEQVLYK